jgi:hypothetical protein
MVEYSILSGKGKIQLRIMNKRINATTAMAIRLKNFRMALLVMRNFILMGGYHGLEP